MSTCCASSAMRKQRGCFLELNAHPERLDLLDSQCQSAKEEGVLVSVNSDAHSTVRFRQPQVWRRPGAARLAGKIRRAQHAPAGSAAQAAQGHDVMMLKLALMGDVMLGRLVNERLKHMQPEEVWGDVLPHLAQADLRIINLECALTLHQKPWMRTEKMFHFRADPEAVRVLQVARIDACALANNHILDYEEQGLRDTLSVLNKAGILHAGAGAEQRKLPSRRLLDVRGAWPCRVALLSYTDNEPDFAADARHSGTNYLEVSLDEATMARIANDIAKARTLGADLVVFSNHWGANFVERPSPEFRSFARRVIELGADIYHGHSAHICQGIEIYRGQTDTVRHRQFHRRLRCPSAAAQRPFLSVQADVRARQAVPHRTAAGVAERGARRVGARQGIRRDLRADGNAVRRIRHEI